jgi:hypothetical protein
MMDSRKMASSKRESKVATRLHRMICGDAVSLVGLMICFGGRGGERTNLSAASTFER